jgi:hypothetical protein
VDILYVLSTNNGSTWSSPTAVDSGAGSDSFSDINVSIQANRNSGAWVAIWQERLASVAGKVDIQYSLSPDTTPPGVTLTSPADGTTVSAPFTVTATFTEPVRNFTDSDITITNGTVSGFSGSIDSYTWDVNPLSGGSVEVSLPVGAANDPTGNDSTVSNIITATHMPAGISEWMILDQ